MELIENEFTFTMFKLLSNSNRYLIRQLLNHGWISISEVHFNLMKLLRVLHHTHIECSSISYVLNSLVTSYLMSVANKFMRSNVLKHHLLDYTINKKLNLDKIIIRELNDCLHNSQVMFAYMINRKPFINIPVEIPISKSDNLKAIENNEKFMESDAFSFDNDFQSFLLPLLRDYTKSSMGYSSHAISINDRIKRGNVCNLLNGDECIQFNNANNFEKISLESGKNFQIQKTGYSQHSNTLKSELNSEVLDTSDIACLQDPDNTQQKSVQKKSSRTKHNRIGFNYSLNITDSVKQQLDYRARESMDSDSDDSVIFENSAKERYDTEVFDNQVNCNFSDNESSLTFSEMNAKVIKGVNMNKFWDNLDNSSSDDNEYDDWDNDFNEDGSDLDETFIQNYRSDFSTGSLCLQNEKITVNEPLNTYEYVNVCFEDDDILCFDHIANINNSWNNSMKDVSSEPRQAKRVSFVLSPSVYNFEPDNDGYCYSMYVLDQVRFQNRIQEFETIIAPYLSSEHRSKIYFQNYQC